jgi:23S rRNA (guanosine2251-2'-O)-methyltransferase
VAQSSVRSTDPVVASEDDRLVIKGRHEVLQALEGSQNIESVLISTAVKGPIGGQIRELAAARRIPVKDLNPDVFSRKFGDKSQGVAALAGAFAYCSLEDLIDGLPAGRRVLVALNHVEDARNLGAIVRTVEASGCGGVIIPKHRAAGMTEWAIRTAQGAATYLPVARVNNLGTALEQLKQQGFWVVGLDGKAEKTYAELMYNESVVIVAGGEDAGLGERIERVCDDVVSIPLAGKTPSLNVSVSTAVVLYEILRQRRFFQK